MYFFYSLSSGSSGNCYYIGNEKQGILVDAGISGKAIKKYLSEKNISMGSIMGVVISHNHTDHIKGLQSLTNKYHIPIFTTEKVWKSILGKKHFNDIPMDCIRYISQQESFLLAKFNITAFVVSHDSPETLGYYFESKEAKLTVVTDLGWICNSAAKYIEKANFLVIESNYDNNMLINGRYPAFLKKRIIGKKGHLDNVATASFIAEKMAGKLNHICLAHLSKENNSPEIAMQTMETALRTNSNRTKNFPIIQVLERNQPTESILLTPNVKI